VNAYRRVFFSLLAAVLCSGVIEGQTRKLTPEVILKKTAARYATYSSYSDVGVVITTYDEATAGRIEKQPFRLFFSRPNKFLVEWLDYYLQKDGRKNVVWSDGKAAFAYWEPDTFEKKQNLEMGIAAATGVSSGAAYTIPRLLIPEIEGWALNDLKKPTLVGEEVFEGELCYRIKGFDSGGDPNEVWIGKRDSLVRKVTTHSSFEAFSTVQEEIHRNIRVNQPIPNDTFDFKPPIALSSPRVSQDGEVLYTPGSPRWNELSSAEGRFKVLMPAPPTSQTLTLETHRGIIVHHSYAARTSGMTCIVDYADLPREFADPGNANTLFDEARDQFTKNVQGKLANETVISQDGYPGREVRAHIFGGEAVARFYLASNRLYQLVITSPDPATRSGPEIDTFFSSFKIMTKPKPVT
jgi:outer membrane lipoprotein-sorting protein